MVNGGLWLDEYSIGCNSSLIFVLVIKKNRIKRGFKKDIIVPTFRLI